MNIQNMIAGLDKKTRDRVLRATEMQTQYLPTPSVALNSALKGGLPKGRIATIWGNKSATKTAFCLQLVAISQQNEIPCAWIDAEQSFDPQWAITMGVDLNNLLLTQEKKMSQVTSFIVDYMKAGFKLIIVDSVSTLLPEVFFEKNDEELKDLGNTKQIGAFSRDLSNAMAMINYSLPDDCVVVFISQTRTNLGGYIATQKPMGGNSLMFYSSTVIKLWSTANQEKQIKGMVASGDKLISKPIGRPVNWLIEYNKTSAPNATGTYDFYYDGDFVGIDSIGEVVDLAIESGIIKKGGAWFTVEDEKMQGRHGVIEYLKNNDTVYQAVLEKIGLS